MTLCIRLKLNKESSLLMLIDFEKAVNSLSWKVLYKILAMFGFDKNFIKWVKMFNTDIQAYTLQCGFLLDEISINRGCRQGDRLSPYLFLIGAEILSMLISMDPNITGIIIREENIKLTQFADDTTVIPDGSQHSLESALNTVEIFGNYSGLKMNIEKTMVIWLGHKRFCKEKLDVKFKLEWGKTEFSMLGLRFSTNLKDIPYINFTDTLRRIKKEMGNWKSRFLTPFGRITRIKTLFLPKLIHLFMSLPVPNALLQEINSLMYEFLWDSSQKENHLCRILKRRVEND